MQGRNKMAEPKGLGGWLILVQVFFIIAVLYSLFVGLAALLVGTGGGILYVDLTALFLIIGIVIAFFLFYNKKKKFILGFLIWIWFSWASFFWLFERDVLLVRSSIYFIIAMGLTIYLLKSKRVKNTFVK
jgi:hypothetical protein